MKPIFLISIICSIGLSSILGCKKSDSPTVPITFAKGEYGGTFSVTFKNYKNTSTSVSQSGTIAMSFTDSTYAYSVAVNFSSDSTAYDSLDDRGRYSQLQGKIIMNDLSWWRADLIWHNSLYLKDTFAIQASEKQLAISQNNSFASWKLNIAPQINLVAVFFTRQIITQTIL
ncbi:MAG: hypothetical protein KGJ59_09105 [Bacteroidota bacterium]|nr:hypothetical protein [Bacteroidota bacterium]